MTGRIEWVCSECGSDEVLHDAYAIWNSETQDFELRSVHDDCVCEGCGEHNSAIISSTT